LSFEEGSDGGEDGVAAGITGSHVHANFDDVGKSSAFTSPSSKAHHQQLPIHEQIAYASIIRASIPESQPFFIGSPVAIPQFFLFIQLQTVTLISATSQKRPLRSGQEFHSYQPRMSPSSCNAPTSLSG
jgi:hypothetical protein